MPGTAVRRWTFVSLALLVLAAPAPAGAADEDTSSSVYLVFDPETGEFVTSHDPGNALPHQTGLEDSVAAAPETPDGGDPGDAAAQPETSAGGFSGGILALSVGGAIALGVGGIVLLRRARRRKD